MKRASKSVVLAVLLMLPLAGCITASILVTRHLISTFRTDVDADLETTFQATVDELQERGYTVKAPKMSDSVATMVSNDAWVVEEKLSNGKTRVHLGIGNMEAKAEQEEAKKVLEGIARRVGDPDAARHIELHEEKL